MKKKGYSGIYACHKYWGKKPPELCAEIIRNFADDNDLVCDPFMGSGVLARICKNYNVNFIGSDLNPSAVSIAEVLVEPPEYHDVMYVFEQISRTVKQEISRMYTNAKGVEASHFVRQEDKIVEVWVKKERRISLDSLEYWQDDENLLRPKYQPQYFRDRKLLRNSRINVDGNQMVSSLFTTRALRSIDFILKAISNLDESQQRIAKFILTSSLGQMSKMVFAIKRRGSNAGDTSNRPKYEVGSWVIGYWRPKLSIEVNVWNVFSGRSIKLANAVKSNVENLSLSLLKNPNAPSTKIDLRCDDAFKVLANLPPSSIDLIVTDPPHSDRIPYLELSEMWNTVIGSEVNYEKEWVLSNSPDREKDESEFLEKMRDLFHLVSTALKDQSRFILIFNTKSKRLWKEIRRIVESKICDLHYEGKFPASYSALSVIQDNRKGALENDWCLVFRKGNSDESSKIKVNGWERTWID